MACPYTIDAQRNVVRIVATGPVHGAHLAETIVAIHEDPQWQYGFDTFWDGSQVTELHLKRGDLSRILQLRQQYAPIAGPGRDIVLVRRALDHIMARIYATMARGSHRETHVCRSAAEAWAILGWPEPPWE